MRRVAPLLLLATLAASVQAITFFADERGRTFAVLDEDEMKSLVATHNAQADLIRALEGEVLRLKKAGNCA